MASTSPLSSDIEEGSNNRYYDKEDYLSSPIIEAAEDEDEEEEYTAKPTSSKRKSTTRKSKKTSKKSKKKTKEVKKKNKSPTPTSEIELNEVIENLTKTKSKPIFSDDGLSSEPELETNPRQLTRRQKAKYLDEYSEELLELPTDSRKKLLTEEEVALRKSETARKRKHQSQQKAERDKMDTINRLLKKQANKKSRADQKKELDNEQEAPPSPPSSLHYLVDKQGQTTLSFPIGMEHLLESFKDKAKYPPKVDNCMVKGCKNPKKYCHPTSLKLSCSLEHYKLLN